MLTKRKRKRQRIALRIQRPTKRRPQIEALGIVSYICEYGSLPAIVVFCF